MDPATTVNPTHKTSCGKNASQRNFGKRLIWNCGGMFDWLS